MSYSLLRPLLFRLDPEHAHELTARGVQLFQAVPPLRALWERTSRVEDSRLVQRIFDVAFPNPVGLAAGFDKDATMVRGLAALGFGYLELGTVTPKPQPGNPKPRLFRVVAERSLINRLGFNNAGAEAFARRLKGVLPFPLPLGINLGKNKVTPNDRALEDYRQLARALGPLASYLVVNLSSPNTPGLRELQDEGFVRELFATVAAVTDRPTLLKIAPDLEAGEAATLSRTAVAAGAAGIIATNTTNDPELLERFGEQGGVSGALLRERSRAIFEAVAAELFGEVPLVAVGGIDSGDEAWRRIRAGASLVQLYSALVFEGPMLVKRINRRLVECLDESGFDSLSEAVGSGRGS